MAVLMAHLQEARRPIQTIEAEIRRLTEELALKNGRFRRREPGERSAEGGSGTHPGRARGAEFLIRRLERSETNNANVLGRIQTSIERLGSPPAPRRRHGAGRGLVRGADPGGRRTSHHLRAGAAHPHRAGPGCELQIDSSSVSRHHALVLVGARDCNHRGFEQHQRGAREWPQSRPPIAA